MQDKKSKVSKFVKKKVRKRKDEKESMGFGGSSER